MSSDRRITVRDWRRRPLLRLRHEEARNQLALDQVHALPAHAGGREASAPESIGGA